MKEERKEGLLKANGAEKTGGVSKVGICGSCTSTDPSLRAASASFPDCRDEEVRSIGRQWKR